MLYGWFCGGSWVWSLSLGDAAQLVGMSAAPSLVTYLPPRLQYLTSRETCTQVGLSSTSDLLLLCPSLIFTLRYQYKSPYLRHLLFFFFFLHQLPISLQLESRSRYLRLLSMPNLSLTPHLQMSKSNLLAHTFNQVTFHKSTTTSPWSPS